MRSRTVVMVCMANQCRSPMAEYLLKRRLGPGSKWTVLSAGTSAIPGSRASASAVEVMARMGVDISAHRSKLVTEELVDSAEIVITMTRSQRDEIVNCFPGARDKVFTLKSLSSERAGLDVADPAGMSASDYQLTRDEIDEIIPDVVRFLHDQE